MITQLLFNHTSPETAFVVDDYPYGFRLRCKIRYWLEYKKNKGFRFVSQTTNPKKMLPEGYFWNKPKASTYSRYGGAMYLDENNYVQWSGLSEYAGLEESRAWVEQFGAAVPQVGQAIMNGWIAAKQHFANVNKIIEEQRERV